jgi:hypothetical protein
MNSTTGLYPNGTNTLLDLISDPTAAFFGEATGFAAATFDRTYATSVASANGINVANKGNFDTVVVPTWLSKAALQQHLNQPIDPKPIAQPAVIVARADMAGVGMWLKDVKGDPVSVCPDLPAPADPAPAGGGSIVAIVPGQSSYDQQFLNLRGMISAARAESLAAKTEILAAIKALKA